MKRTISNCLFILTSSIAIGSITAISENFISLTVDSFLPEISKINEFSRPGTITLLDNDGEIIQKIGAVSREKVAPGEMPTLIKKAFIASEDRRFYNHKGVDLLGISRAIITNIRKRSVVEGASTITQQLARIIFLNQERTLKRKLKEITLAYKLERELTKGEIIEQYLNNVYLGSGAYGISDAAWIYFKKKPENLSLSEIALIAGITPAPSLFSPLVNSDLALKRRSMVLQKMYLEKFISKEELSSALTSPLILQPAIPKYSISKAPFFTSWAQQSLPYLLTKEQLEIGGLQIHTSLILDWQLKAKDILLNYSPKDTNGAIVAIEPNTGLIRVLVGGKNFYQNQFNRATQALRSPGSTFKIFTYAAAINEGYKPEDVLFDTPRCWYGYCPKNFGGKYYGEISLIKALANSLNTVAVDLLSKVGFKKVISIANSFGIGQDRVLGRYYSLAIGANEETVLNMTAAYAGFTNRGRYIKPSPIKEIKSSNNKILWSQEINIKKSTIAIPIKVADTINWMLRKVVTEGSGVAASLKDREVAGKTGTSEGNRDLWFIGSIPQLSTGVWFGKDNNEIIDGTSGDAAYAWRKFMEGINNDLKILKFPDPPLKVN
ncbi:transglycosylase domain-containing protein [Prochlorococcus marinus]|uniref:transglycosylase domain-containing protein n=1 Tax=Prochlorococcus marinus TaxID=1219 RepID=UPI0022B50F5D|nr:PBP1A family penicillin-binding protein [Prochlorococcus marinus]